MGRAHGVPAAELTITAAPYLESRRARAPYRRWLLAGVIGLSLALALVVSLQLVWTR